MICLFGYRRLKSEVYFIALESVMYYSISYITRVTEIEK